MGTNPFHHVFDPSFVARCERGGDGHVGTPPFFELGCGHCLCSTCALLAAQEECPLCGWLPHPAVSTMFSRYADGVVVFGCSHVVTTERAPHVPQVWQPRNELFNTFGFYLGASLCVEMAAIFVRKPHLFGGAAAHGAIAGAFNAIGPSVPDQYIDAVVRARADAVRCVERRAVDTPADEPFPPELAALVAQQPRDAARAVVVAKAATHLAVLLPKEGGEAIVFDPYGVGRDRAPYLATFPAAGAAACFLAERLRGGRAPDLPAAHDGGEVAYAVLEGAGADAPPQRQLSLATAAAAPAAAADPGPWGWRASEWHAAGTAAEQRLWAGYEESLDDLLRREAAARGELRDWERCRAGTLRCDAYLRATRPAPVEDPDAAQLRGRSPRRLEFAASPLPSPRRPAHPVAAHGVVSSLSFSTPSRPGSPGSAAASTAGTPAARRRTAPTALLLLTLPGPEAAGVGREEAEGRRCVAAGERRGRRALEEWEKVKQVVARSRGGPPRVPRVARGARPVASP